MTKILDKIWDTFIFYMGNISVNKFIKYKLNINKTKKNIIKEFNVHI